MTDPTENLTVHDVLKQSDQMVAAFGQIGAGLAAFCVNYAAGVQDFDAYPDKDQMHELAKIMLQEFAEGTFNNKAPVMNMNMPGML